MGSERPEPIVVYLHFIIKRLKITEIFSIRKDFTEVAERNIVIKNKTYGDHIQ